LGSGGAGEGDQGSEYHRHCVPAPHALRSLIVDVADATT
jgi:hypothetical protein